MSRLNLLWLKLLVLKADFLEQNWCVINAEQRVLHLKGRALALSNVICISNTTIVDAKAVIYAY